MKLIYKADNIAEAHIVSGMLKSHGIESHVGGHYLQGGVGDLMAMGFANIHVNNEDIDAAKLIIASYENKRTNQDFEDEAETKKASWPYWILIAVLMVTTFLLYLR